MKRYYLQATAISPLAIRADHAEGGVDTASYIPGVTLLGSLAAAHRMLRSENQHENEFAQFFLHERVHFPHLYPASFELQTFTAAGRPVMPLPKTAQTCKRFKGFQPLPGENPDEERHGVRDSLLDWGLFSLLSQQQASVSTVLAPFAEHERCQYPLENNSSKRCNQVMDHASPSYYRRGDSKNLQQRMEAKTSNKRLQTRTGINRDWGVVEESILYNREVFQEGSRFWGEVVVSDELAYTFEQFIEKANKEGVIRVGTGRTRGLGRVEIRMVKNEQQGNTFKSKLEDFSALVKKQAREMSVQNIAPFYFAITLNSSSILCDAFLRYKKTLDPASLHELLRLSDAFSPDTFQRLYQSVGIQRVTGWNELWGTPRPTDYALEPGSVFLYSCKQALGDELIAALQALEEEGIGRRRSEGFGRISISDPFHLEREQA